MRKLRILSGAMLVIGASLGAVLISGAPASARRDANWVNDHVEWTSPNAGSAKSQVVGWENTCTDEFNHNRATMQHGNEAQQRSVVNASAYYQSVWLTRRNDPRNINNTPVNAGSQVPMQINDLLFLCGIITMNASGFGIASDHKVTNSRYPNDRDPVPDSPAAAYKVNQASRYESNSRIYNVSVVNGPGSITDKPIGDVLGYKRDQDSRYWNARPVPFTYNPPNNIPQGVYKITIAVEYATIQTYHHYGSAGTNRCTLSSTGKGATVAYNAFSRCKHRTEYYTFTFNIRSPIPPASVFPSSTVDKPKMTYPDTATFHHYVNVSGYTILPGTVDWRIQRYRNGAPMGGPVSGKFDVRNNGQHLVGGARAFNATAADAGDRICERLQLSGPFNVNIAGNRPNPSEVCTVIVARPYLTATNNDVWAGSRFDLGHNRCNGQAARLSSISSWVSGGAGAVGEYGVLALGPVLDFGSGHNPGGKGLTFANTPGLGNFASPTRCLPDYYSQVGTDGAITLGGTVNLNALPGGAGKHKYIINGNATINGGTLPNNMQATILVNGTVRITGDLLYDNNYSTAANIASLGIIARGNIYVQENVENINGLLITQGTLQTCVRTNQTSTYAPLTTDVCTKGLTVYGAVIADQIYWQRTRGTVGASQPYAESVQFDPGLYLSSPFSSTTTSSSIKVEDTKELPPIY